MPRDSVVRFWRPPTSYGERRPFLLRGITGSTSPPWFTFLPGYLPPALFPLPSELSTSNPSTSVSFLRYPHRSPDLVVAMPRQYRRGRPLAINLAPSCSRLLFEANWGTRRQGVLESRGKLTLHYSRAP